MPKEVFPGEMRVAQTPSTVALLTKKGFQVLVESGAGAAASFTDGQYAEAAQQDKLPTKLLELVVG